MRVADIVTKVNAKYGAPMGRGNRGERPDGEKIYSKRVPMCRCCGAYDIGGAYWGIGKELRVEFNKDLSYVKYFRVGE
jgi:hypothetical protein